jgi:hypothetical protein
MGHPRLRTETKLCIYFKTFRKKNCVSFPKSIKSNTILENLKQAQKQNVFWRVAPFLYLSCQIGILNVDAFKKLP